MIELEDDDVEPAFVLTEPPRRIDPSELPQSPRKVATAALAAGLTTVCWASAGEQPPTLYKSSSTEGSKEVHAVGEVRFSGYTNRMYVVEAADPTMPFGFQSHFAGRQYPDGRKASAGAFKYARVMDPVGIPVELRATYDLMKPKRGDFETAKSFRAREEHVETMLHEMDVAYNDGTLHWLHSFYFHAAEEFEAWLTDWRSYFA
jgi:hypothetical protein